MTDNVMAESTAARAASERSRRNGHAPLQVSGIWKRFGDTDVVRDVSFALESGRILGIVGPNGAGKTTSIRIALGIVRPDRGRVSTMGEPLSQEARNRIGYLPEERGLYRGQRVLPTIVYLARLKGLEHADATRRAGAVLERLGMAEHQRRKVSELSHGMAQLIQFATTIIHEPDVVVLDEPFSALDPVNVRLMKDIILEMRQRGTALVLSTHQMAQVEELCDSVVMIDDGAVVLEGRLADIRRSYRSDRVSVVSDPPPGELSGVADVTRERDGVMMRLLPGTAPEAVLRQLLDAGHSIESFEVETPGMEDIFISVAGRNHA